MLDVVREVGSGAPIQIGEQREIETMTADLARLARSAVIVCEHVHEGPSPDEDIAEADMDALQDQLRQIDEIARALRVACRPA